MNSRSIKVKSGVQILCILFNSDYTIAISPLLLWWTNKQQNGVTKAGVLIVSQIVMTKENNNIV